MYNVILNNYNGVIHMEELRIKLENLILARGTMNKDVLILSQQLDDYIINYYKDKVDLDCRQAI